MVIFLMWFRQSCFLTPFSRTMSCRIDAYSRCHLCWYCFREFRNKVNVKHHITCIQTSDGEQKSIRLSTHVQSVKGILIQRNNAIVAESQFVLHCHHKFQLVELKQKVKTYPVDKHYFIGESQSCFKMFRATHSKVACLAIFCNVRCEFQ